jgi:Flp pilus assembly protein TadG
MRLPLPLSTIRSRIDTDVRGSISVELGFIAPMILLLVLGTIEVSMAISSNMTLQLAARAGTNHGLASPPASGNTAAVVASARAALPSDWLTATPNPALVAASIICECALTGAVACGGSCAAGEAKHQYLKVDVSRTYQTIFSSRYFSPSFAMANMSMVRLQ